MNVYLIDNYDSFTYNLYQLVGDLLTIAVNQQRIPSFTISVKRNDDPSLMQLSHAHPDRIIISPGPGTPENQQYFGQCTHLLQTISKTVPTLGVCLGMQGIIHAFGGRIIRAQQPMHGKKSLITHAQTGLFTGIPNALEVMRYHSLIADVTHFPEDLRISAFIQRDPQETFTMRLSKHHPDDEIMGIYHQQYPIYGVQYHPESFASEGGKDLLMNFLFPHAQSQHQPI